MALSRNPFEVLGLSPDVVASLPEQDLFTLVKAVYRSLLKTYHPDKTSGRAQAEIQNEPDYNRKAVELNLAFEELNLMRNPAKFRRQRKLFAAPRPRNVRNKALTLEKEIAQLKSSQEHMADSYFNYLISQRPWAWPDYPGSATEPAVGLFKMHQGTCLGLTDLAIGRNLKGQPWLLGSNYKEIRLERDGGLSVRPVGRSRFARAGYIWLLGVVPVDDLELWPVLEKEPPKEDFFRAPALNAKLGIDGTAPSILNTISQANFKSRCLPLLQPRIMERAYLFSLQRPDFEERDLITLEGVIVKITKL